MKHQVKVVLSILLANVVMRAPMQSEPVLPDVTMLVQQTVLQQHLAESEEQHYVVREDTNDIRLSKKCMWAPRCPAPFGLDKEAGVAYRVLNYSEKHFEVFWLDGVRVARALPACDGCPHGLGPVEYLVTDIPISGAELAAENERVDRELAEAKSLRAERKDASSHADPPPIQLSRVLEVCTVSNPRRETLESRSTILLDFACNTSEATLSAADRVLKPLAGTIGIDEEDHAVQHVEGKFLDEVDLGGDIRVKKGTRVTITTRRVAPGIWLPSRLDARGEGRYFGFAISGDGHIFWGKYRRFRSTSTILPAK
jgi:hypothetical protein